MKFNYYDSEQISTRAASPSASTLSISPSANAKDDLSANSINERENVAPVAGKASTELNFDPEVEPRGQNSREPKDWLKDVTSGDIPQRECALKNLEWQWGIPRLVAETAVQLASNNLAIRATAQRRLEHLGCDGIPAVHAVGQWEDTELNSRCRQLMNYYLVTQPLSELLKFPEILEYLPNARLSQRFHETVDSPETLIRMVKEVSLLMLVPSLLNERLKNLEDEISSTTNADATDLLKEELRRLCNLPQLGQEIQMALANASRSPDSNQKSSFD